MRTLMPLQAAAACLLLLAAAHADARSCESLAAAHGIVCCIGSQLANVICVVPNHHCAAHEKWHQFACQLGREQRRLRMHAVTQATGKEGGSCGILPAGPATRAWCAS